MYSKSFKILLSVFLSVLLIFIFYLFNNKIKVGAPDADGFTALERGTASDIVKTSSSALAFILLWLASYVIAPAKKMRLLYSFIWAMILVAVLFFIGELMGVLIWGLEF